MADVQNMPVTTAAVAKSMPFSVRFGYGLARKLACTGEREDRMRLVSISISHYVEKVRWALDTLCISRGDETLYTEDGHLPGMHAAFTVPASGGVASMTPMLVTRRKGDKAVIWDSSDILSWLCEEYEELAFLYPADIRNEVHALEELYDQDLAVPLRRFAYSIILNYPGLAKKIVASELTWIERLLFPLLLPILKKKLSRLIAIDFSKDSTTMDETLTQIVKVFDRVAERLSDGRRYLVGDRFTAADIAFASLAYPVAAVLDRETWAVRMPDVDEFPQEYTARLACLVEHPAGKFAARIYKEHRHASAPTAENPVPATVLSRPMRVHWNPTACYIPKAVVASVFIGIGVVALWGFRCFRS